jgi:hypothetical protein
MFFLNHSVQTFYCFCLVIFLSITTYFWAPANIRSDYQLLLNKCTTCEVARQLAEEDFKANKYQIIYWGLEAYPPDQLNCRMCNFIKKHQIKIIRGGCVMFSEVECYDIRMRELLFKDYFPKPK